MMESSANACSAGYAAKIDLRPVANVVASCAPFAERHVIAALQTLQGHYGCLPRAALDELARRSGIPVARLFGVATFYAEFRLTPPGRHGVRLCRGTACHVRGASRLLEVIGRRFGVADGGTTADGRFTLETVACLGTCYLAPVMAIDGRYYGNVTPDRAIAMLENLA